MFTLRLWGLLCPCLQKEEDKSARQCLLQLNQLGARVDWHTSPKKQQHNVNNVAGAAAAAATGFVQSLFGGKSSEAASSTTSSTTRSSSISQSHTDIKPPTPAQFRLVDATKDSINWGQPYPELQLVPLPQQIEQQQVEVEQSSSMSSSPGGRLSSMSMTTMMMKQNAMSYQLDIPLHHVLRIESIEPTMLVIITKDVHNNNFNGTINNDNDPTTAEKEVARISFSSSDDRDAVSLDLKVLVEWNRHRQPDIEEELPVTAGIRARAQKAAHFARREIELREKKREREKRKSQHMQGGAGLKYTAMAMANQASSTT